jgi:hypothetical protein
MTPSYSSSLAATRICGVLMVLIVLIASRCETILSLSRATAIAQYRRQGSPKDNAQAFAG